MITNTPDLPIREHAQHTSLYRQAWKPHKEQIKILALKINNEIEEQVLNLCGEKKNMEDEIQEPDLNSPGSLQ